MMEPLRDTDTDAVPAGSDGGTSSCLLLTINDTRLLVPRTLVAEVIRHTFVDLEEDEETGLRTFDWRGCRVPHIRNVPGGEIDLGGTQDEARLVIFYGLQDTRALPFYGLSVSRSPQLLLVEEQDLKELDDGSAHPAALMTVTLQGKDAVIPRVDYFENAILKLMH